MNKDYRTPEEIMKEIAKAYTELGNKLDELNRMIIQKGGGIHHN